HGAGALGPARGGRRRDRVPRIRRGLLRHGSDARGERRPVDVVTESGEHPRRHPLVSDRRDPRTPASVRVREVGPRDGFQNEPEIIPTPRKVELIDALARTGLARLEVTSFVRADVIPQLADAAEVLAAIDVPAQVAVSV